MNDKTLKNDSKEENINKKCKVEEEFGWWDKECTNQFKQLKPKFRKFFIEWLHNGYNGRAAYHKHCNPNVDEHSARNCAYRLFSNKHIKFIINKMNQSIEADLILCKQAFIDALGATKQGEVDHGARISAAKNLLTLNGQLVEKMETKHTFPDNIEIKFT
jgi:hypothetical protein